MEPWSWADLKSSLIIEFDESCDRVDDSRDRSDDRRLEIRLRNWFGVELSILSASSYVGSCPVLYWLGIAAFLVWPSILSVDVRWNVSSAITTSMSSVSASEGAIDVEHSSFTPSKSQVEIWLWESVSITDEVSELNLFQNFLWNIRTFAWKVKNRDLLKILWTNSYFVNFVRIFEGIVDTYSNEYATNNHHDGNNNFTRYW